jgi:hypothetical protein
LKKLKKNFEIKMVLEHRKNGEVSHRFYDVGKCSDEDYQMFPENIEEAKKYLENSLCPKIDSNDEYIGLMNKFHDETERKSFSLNVFLCDPKYDKNCDTLENTKLILDNIYWETSVL